MKQLFIITVLICLIGCSSTDNPPKDEAFKQVTIKQLVEKESDYRGKRVSLDAYVIGSEYNPSEDGAQFFILSLGENKVRKKNSSLYNPETQFKIRAVEDGYNKEIIEDCYRMAMIARRMGQKVTVFGTYEPGKEFYYYERGVDLHIAKMRIGNKTINTDYADKSKIAHETPGILKQVYQKGKKLLELLKKLR